MNQSDDGADARQGSLCGAAHPTRPDVFCTRPRGHTDAHVATFGPHRPQSRRQHEIARWLSTSTERTDHD